MTTRFLAVATRWDIVMMTLRHYYALREKNASWPFAVVILLVLIGVGLCLRSNSKHSRRTKDMTIR